MSGHCKIWLWAAHSFPRQPKVCGTTTWKAKEQELWICCGCETFSKIRSLPDKCIHSILEDNQWAHIAKCPCTHCTRAYTLVNTQLSVHSNYTQTVCKYVCIYIHVHLHFIYNEIIYDNNMLSWNLIVAPSSLLSLERMNHRSPKSGPPNWISPQWCSLLLPPAGLQDTSWNSGWWLQPQKYGCHGGKAKDVTDVTGTLSRPKWYLTSNFQYLESEPRFL